MKKVVVFDIDDILWGLVTRVANQLNIPIEKLTTFVIKECPNLTKEEIDSIYDLFNREETFENIEWFDGVDRINNLNAEVHICSNIFRKELGDVKLVQLIEKFPNIPIENFHLNLVVDSTKKEIPNNTFIFVDDSPYNIRNNIATHKIMLKRVWNTSKDGMDILKDTPVKQFDTFNEIMDYIESLL